MPLADPGISDGVRTMVREAKRRGWSLNELARRLDAKSGMVSKWARGLRSPSLEYAVRIEKVLGIPPRDFTSYKPVKRAA